MPETLNRLTCCRQKHIVHPAPGKILEKALETERRAVGRLTEVDQIKDTFVSAVSHELRTPITNIVGYLELLLDGAYGEPNEDQAQALTRVDINSRRLLTLIDDLLEVRRITLPAASSAA